jgi:2-phosphoglycerate kinase
MNNIPSDVKCHVKDFVFKCQTIEKALAMGRSPIFWIIGGPGTGKGTQCVRLAQKFKLAHISSGDLLRAEVAKNPLQRKEINSLMKSGQLVQRDIGICIFCAEYLTCYT